MNGLDQVLRGQEIPDFECPSSGGETTIFTPFNRSSSFDSNELTHSDTSQLHLNAVDLSNPKKAMSLSVLSRELSTNFWGHRKIKRTINYERVSHFGDRNRRSELNGSQDAQGDSVLAQKQLKTYCEEELPPMVINQSLRPEERPMDSHSYSKEHEETTPKSSTTKNVKWSVPGKLRHALSKSQLKFCAQDTCAKRHYKKVGISLKEFCNSCFHRWNRKSHTESSSDDGLSKLWQEYNQAYLDVLNETYKSLAELRACLN